MKMNNVLAILLMSLFSVSLASADNKDVALVLKTAGKVQINKQGRSTALSARRGHRLHSGEVVKTGERSLAALVFTDDKSLLKVRSNSNVTINGKRENNSIVKRIKIAFGEIWAKVTKQNTSLRVESPSGVATVKGTEFNALYNNNNFIIFCQEGLMEVANQLGTILLGANEMARITRGQPPERISGDPSTIFDMSDQDEPAGQMEIEYEDDEGNKKKLILDFN